MNLKLEATNGMRLTGLFVSARKRNSVNALRKLRRYALARPSVRLSVCPSDTRVTHGWISQTRLKSGLCNFHRTDQSINQSINIFCRVA